MLTSRSHLILGAVCALTVVPVVPDVVPMGNSGIVLVQSAEAQTSTEWTDGALNNPNWNVNNNWDEGVPNSSTTATHTTTLTDIQVNASAECFSFEGKGGSTDRFLEMDAGEAWTVGSGGLFFSSGIGSGFFVVKYDNGSSGDLTSISVDGDVTGITFVPTTGIGLRGQYINLAVGGDVINTSLTVSDHCVIDIDGSVHGGTRDWTVGDDRSVTIGLQSPCGCGLDRLC